MATISPLTEPLLTPRDAATLLALSVKTVYRLAAKAEIPCFLLRDVGRKTTIRFSRTELERWLADRRVLPAGVRGAGTPTRRSR